MRGASKNVNFKASTQFFAHNVHSSMNMNNDLRSVLADVSISRYFISHQSNCMNNLWWIIYFHLAGLCHNDLAVSYDTRQLGFPHTNVCEHNYLTISPKPITQFCENGILSLLSTYWKNHIFHILFLTIFIKKLAKLDTICFISFQ